MLKLCRNRLFAMALLIAAIPTFNYAAAIVQVSPKPTTVAMDKASKIDINTATVDQLKTIPGIGAAYSKRIVDGRPYANKSQLLSKGVIPADTYNKIKDQIVATQPKGK